MKTTLMALVAALIGLVFLPSRTEAGERRYYRDDCGYGYSQPYLNYWRAANYYGGERQYNHRSYYGHDRRDYYYDRRDYDRYREPRRVIIYYTPYWGGGGGCR